MGFIADTITKLVPTLAREIARTQMTQNAINEATGTGTITDENAGFHQLGGGRRDATFVDKDISMDEAVRLYEKNALAKWLLDTMRDLIVGQGITVVSPDERVQELLDDFWNHPVNNMKVNVPQNVLSLLLFGEQLLPVELGVRGGPMVVTTIDPGDIELVEHDPQNGSMPIGVRRLSDGDKAGKAYGIVYKLPDAQIFSPETAALRKAEFGQHRAFWNKINYAIATQTRGRSEYYGLRDHLEGYGQLIYERGIRVADLQKFFYDIEFTDAEQPEIDAWVAKTSAPNHGDIRAHNQRIKWNMVSAALQSMEISEDFRVQRNYILGAVSLPEHWNGGGGDINRATAKAMDIPTFLRYTARQVTVRNQLECMLDYQLAQHVEEGLIDAEQAKQYELVLPQISTEDLKTTADTLVSVTGALVVAASKGWVSDSEARELFKVVAERTGVQLEDNDETMAPAESVGMKKFNDELAKFREAAADLKRGHTA